MALVLDGTTGIVSANIADGTISASDLASGAITSAALPAGSVIQVVNATYSTQVSTSSASYVDSGLSATITPSSASNKVLVFANIPDAHNASTDSLVYLNVVRDSTQIIEFTRHSDHIGTAASIVTYGGSTSYLDSPNTTSATTYKVQFRVHSAGTTQQLFTNSSTGTIALMEIVA